MGALSLKDRINNSTENIVNGKELIRQAIINKKIGNPIKNSTFEQLANSITNGNTKEKLLIFFSSFLPNYLTFSVNLTTSNGQYEEIESIEGLKIFKIIKEGTFNFTASAEKYENISGTISFNSNDNKKGVFLNFFEIYRNISYNSTSQVYFYSSLPFINTNSYILVKQYNKTIIDNCLYYTEQNQKIYYKINLLTNTKTKVAEGTSAGDDIGFSTKTDEQLGFKVLSKYLFKFSSKTNTIVNLGQFSSLNSGKFFCSYKLGGNIYTFSLISSTTTINEININTNTESLILQNATVNSSYIYPDFIRNFKEKILIGEKKSGNLITFSLLDPILKTITFLKNINHYQSDNVVFLNQTTFLGIDILEDKYLIVYSNYMSDTSGDFIYRVPYIRAFKIDDAFNISKEIPFKKQSVIHRDCAINGAFIPILNTKNYLLVGMDNNYNTTIGKYFYQIFNVNQLLSN